VTLDAPGAGRSRTQPMTDVLLVSIGATGGWRAATSELAAALTRAGANTEIAAADPFPTVRTFALTDYVQARVARRAAQREIARCAPRAIIYCSISAALLWPAPGAIFLDSVAAENRPGRHGIWQRPVERRRLAQASVILAWSDRALDPLGATHRRKTIVVPPPVEGFPGTQARDIAAVTYAGNPVKRRLDAVLDAWSRARGADETLVVTGIDALTPREGVQLASRRTPEQFRALLQRARIFIAAPEREDFGIAALEALACGCLLVTTPSKGPYPGRALAGTLDPRLLGEDLPAAIRTALDDPRPGYSDHAAVLLSPFRKEAIDRTIAADVLPTLLQGSRHP
jgi:glycosyltransferase involved in cell wall biosynthesis